MTIQFFPFPGADGRQSNFVRSTSNPEAVQVPDLMLYSQLSVRFKPVQQNPTGAFGARISALDGTGMTAVAMVYKKAAGSAAVALATTGIMSWNGSGYFEGTLDLNTEEAITAAGSAAAGSGVDVRLAFILLDAYGQPTIAEAGTRLFYTLPPDDLPDPTSVTETIFANLLQGAMTDTDTLLWRRSGTSFYGDVPIFGAPNILANLSASFTVAGVTPTPTSGTDVETVGGQSGERYIFRVKVAGTYETAAYTAATNKPGDPATIARGGTPPANNHDRWYLDISSPAQRIYLNHGANANAQAHADYYLRFLADAGATVTLGFDTTDNQSSGSSNMDITVLGASEAVGAAASSREALSFSTAGNTDVTPTSARHAAAVTVGAGSGSYTRTLALLTTGRLAGDMVLLRLRMPTTANPTVEVRNATSGGTLLASVSGNATGSDYFVALVYSGSAWELWGITSDAAVDLVAALAGKQPLDNTLTALAGLTVSANGLLQGTGADSFQLTTFNANTFPARASTGDLAAKPITDQALALLDDATAAAQRTTLGVEGRSVRLTASTTDATQTEMLTSSNGRATLPNNSGWTFSGRLVARFAGAASWTARDSTREWRRVASSSDGSKLVAVVYGGQIYTSTDYGVTWTARESARNWYGVASSSDGTKLVAVVNGGQIYTSTDSGATWTARDSGRGWFGVASSSDGTNLVAVVNGGQIYTSTDSGANWTARASSALWMNVASSSDGTKLVAVVNGGQIYTSTDSGVNWTARDSNRSWFDVASSSDGTKLVAAVNGGQLFTSADSGATWTARDSIRGWYSVASSSDGTKLVAVVSGGQIYTSTDSGVTWTARDSSRSWRGVASSSDGTRLVAGVSAGQIYTAVNSDPETQALHFAGKANCDSAANTITVSGGTELQLNPIGSFTWGFALDADTTNGAVRARVTGESGKAISWALTLDFTEVTT